MNRPTDRLGRVLVLTGTLLGLVLQAGPAMATIPPSVPVPGPGSLALLALGAGVAALIALRRK